MFKLKIANLATVTTVLFHITACDPSLRVDADTGAGRLERVAGPHVHDVHGLQGDVIDVHAGDLHDQLAAIPGLTVIEVPEQAPPGYRFFMLEYQQPVDHQDPDGAVFSQRMALLHRSSDAPMIFNTQGYALYAPYIHEPTALVAGNQLSVEHRYYGDSRPQPTDWRFLTVAQAAADHHRIVQAMKPLYSGAWVSTGGSKGGMTALYHRRFHPADVDATIPYVAPLDNGVEDSRYLAFLHRVGDADCRLHLRALQREALLRRHRLVPTIEYLAALYGTGFELIRGGGDAALDIAVAELGFQFWQYGHVSYCEYLPGVDASDEAFIELLAPTAYYATDLGVEYFLGYYYQSLAEIGTARLPTEHLRDLLLHDPNDYTLYTGDLEVPAFDPAVMDDIAAWARSESESVLYIYGEIDPWTAGAWPTPPPGNDVHVFIAPGGNHGVGIADLSPADQAAAHALLERWTGVSVDPAARMAGPAPAVGRRAAGDHLARHLAGVAR